MSKAHSLTVWVSSSIGLACLAGQVHIHQLHNVSLYGIFSININSFFQVAVGNLHIGTSIIALFAYFSRRDLFMSIVGVTISLVSPLSMMIGGFINNNCILSVLGSGLLIAAKLFNRFVFHIFFLSTIFGIFPLKSIWV